MIYYTSDNHIYHENILKLAHRPYKTVEEMNADIIKKWNAKVQKNDDVYILGDMFYKAKDTTQITDVLKLLNGKKHLVRGNHDRFLNSINWKEYFEEVVYYKEISDNDRMVVLFHYPIEEWNGYYRNSYMLYGHVHDNDATIKSHPRKFNVGVDVNDFEPKTLDELIAKEKNKCVGYHKVAATTGWSNAANPIKKTEYECWGTASREHCTCGGDKSKCDFYPVPKNKSK